MMKTRRAGSCAAATTRSAPDKLGKAYDRQQAAEYLMKVLDIVDGKIEDIRVLPVQEEPCRGPVKDRRAQKEPVGAAAS